MCIIVNIFTQLGRQMTIRKLLAKKRELLNNKDTDLVHYKEELQKIITDQEMVDAYVNNYIKVEVDALGNVGTTTPNPIFNKDSNGCFYHQYDIHQNNHVKHAYRKRDANKLCKLALEDCKKYGDYHKEQFATNLTCDKYLVKYSLQNTQYCQDKFRVFSTASDRQTAYNDLMSELSNVEAIRCVEQEVICTIQDDRICEDTHITAVGNNDQQVVGVDTQTHHCVHSC